MPTVISLLEEIVASLANGSGGGEGVYQPLDSDLSAIAALSTTTFGRALLTLAGAAELRAAAELGTAAELRAAAELGTAAELNVADLVSAITVRAANLVLAGPASGAAAGPSWRQLARADLPLAVSQPADHGLIAWTLDPLDATNTVQPTSGQLAIHRVIATRDGPVANILTDVQGSGSGLTANQCSMALFDAAGARLALTGDLSGVLNSTGTKTMPLAASVNVSFGMPYYIMMLLNGTTMPTLRRGTTSERMINFNLPASAPRFATGSSGNISIPSNITISSYAFGQNSFFLALS